MKIAILAGGHGTRLAEETQVRPKPMVEIGGMPIMWHIMMHYSRYGHDRFVIALGYKGEFIKKYFADYCALQGNLTVRMDRENGSSIRAHGKAHPQWRVDLIETGNETLTGGRLKRLGPYLGRGTFMLTWGDGVSDVDLDELLAFHRRHGKLATVTAVRPPARYGHMQFDGERVTRFSEKPQTAEGWINGAFFVLEPEVLEYIDGDMVMFEHAPLERLARDGELMAFKHTGFWACMDTLRDKTRLEELWNSGNRPWATWEKQTCGSSSPAISATSALS
ncbi:MAG: glucose-1-phosphate cytidylyltransferase [Hyphomicrobiaceae bacterium]|nr:glucose-1-phosphate cytidylyltransferase [Hyphomicrobiaceae bacterium]